MTKLKCIIIQADQRLITESKKVEHALLGFKKVLEKGWQHMLLGSATLVLESVMEFVQLIESFASLNER